MAYSLNDKLVIICYVQTIITLPLLIAVIYSLTNFKELRTRSFGLVLMLMIAEMARFLYPFIYLDPVDGTLRCSVQGAYDQFFEFATAAWTVTIALSLDRAVVQKAEPLPLWWCNIFVWGLAALSAALPFSTNSFGIATNWCWIASEESSARGSIGSNWRWGFYAIEIGIAGIVICVIYRRVSVAVQGYLLLESGTENQRLIRLAKQLKWYPIMYVIGWVPTIIFRGFMSNGYAGGSSDHSGAILYTCLRASFLQAFSNCIVYGCTKPVRSAWADKYSSAQRSIRALSIAKIVFRYHPSSGTATNDTITRTGISFSGNNLDDLTTHSTNDPAPCRDSKGDFALELTANDFTKPIFDPGSINQNVLDLEKNTAQKIHRPSIQLNASVIGSVARSSPLYRGGAVSLRSNLTQQRPSTDPGDPVRLGLPTPP